MTQKLGTKIYPWCRIVHHEEGASFGVAEVDTQKFMDTNYYEPDMPRESVQVDPAHVAPKAIACMCVHGHVCVLNLGS